MLSGSTNYSINRDALITHSYRILGAIRSGGAATADEISDGAIALNMMIKSWQTDGLQLWVIKRASLIPEKGKQVYALGTDHCSLNMNKTEVKVAGSATDVNLDVDATSGMTVADNIGVVLDDGTIHWTTIQSITDSDTVVLTAGLPSAASIDNHVYFYTTKIDRPHELLEVYRRYNGIDTSLEALSREDYNLLPNKGLESIPVSYYYDPQLTSSNLYIWPTADTSVASDYTIELVIKKPFDDMDSSTDDFEFPQEWFEPIAYGLAVRLAPMIGYPIRDRQILIAEADRMKELVMGFDVEHTSVQFTP